ncbi:hypothetical protein AB834_02160 [PVC group bacterium (ex Bugula neritina AB1)]|nr:hypothetical protein AB834_02160 [PVC group bacterium (ex Bugula neritina AB1)]
MPTYDYRCEKCSHVFEIFHGMNDSSQKKCEKCDGVAGKLIGAGSGVIYKGTGFYTTDYNRSKHYRESSKKEN